MRVDIVKGGPYDVGKAQITNRRGTPSIPSFSKNDDETEGSTHEMITSSPM